MRVAIVGAGAVGLRVARHLSDAPGMERLAITDTDAGRAGAVAASIGSPAGAAALLPNLFNGSDVAVLCGPSGGGEHRRWAEAALEAGAHVVSVADGIDDVRALLELDLEARERNLAVVTGAGFSPGLSCVLASHAGTELTAVDEVHVAKAGTGGPACARQHRQAQRTGASEWRDGAWIRRRSGSGRKLCWFPEPVGGRDCYRAGVADGLVLVPAFPGVSRVSARVAASHRERLASRVGVEPRPAASWLGLVKAANTDRLGAVRVEVRGRVGLTREVRVLGVVDRPATAAAAVAAVSALWAPAGRLARPGAGGLAELAGDTTAFLRDLALRGVRAAVFDAGAGVLA